MFDVRPLPQLVIKNHPQVFYFFYLFNFIFTNFNFVVFIIFFLPMIMNLVLM